MVVAVSVKHHEHTFTALYWHLGPYGRQDVHVHSCFDEDCHRVLIGSGRRCDGVEGEHWRATLGDESLSIDSASAPEPQQVSPPDGWQYGVVIDRDGKPCVWGCGDGEGGRRRQRMRLRYQRVLGPCLLPLHREERSA